jgi:hypothetical protein
MCPCPLHFSQPNFMTQSYSTIPHPLPNFIFALDPFSQPIVKSRWKLPVDSVKTAQKPPCGDDL